MDYIILFDDESNILKIFKERFVELDIKLDIKDYNDLGNLQKVLSDEKLIQNAKALVFDLAKDKDEERSHRFEILRNINENYNTNRIPIFIHSAHLDFYDDFTDNGTVYKIPKDDKSISRVCNKIKIMHQSGFLDLFCPGGRIEQKIMIELHKAFTEQYKDDEIELIINNIEKSNQDNLIDRVHEVFERIALRSMYQNSLSINDGEGGSVEVNSIEHFYRRKSNYDFWTGDVFKHNDLDLRILVMIPRCNIQNNNYDEVLLCKIIDLKEESLKALSKEENLKRALTDDVTLKFIAERFRYLPKNPLFTGGLIDYTTHFSITSKVLLENFHYIISLSDELTNDVMRKFSSYMLRTGISQIDVHEALEYLKTIAKN